MSRTISELTKTQREFDSHHGRPGHNWAQRIDQNHIPLLLELTVALTGEVGEFANIAKKVARGDFSLSEGRPHLAGELADIFIYLLKLADQLEIDLEGEFYRKLEINEKRFKGFDNSPLK
jgi:NTP pyrophosphatase (non-canonical NTP hydrolase)